MTTADCCVGLMCEIPPGASAGTCQPPKQPPPPEGGVPEGGIPEGGVDAPPPCAEYGQICTQDSDCCNGVPCNGGRCIILVR